MAKYPAVGDVKTRLGETMGYEEAAKLYMCFLKDTVEKVRQLRTPFFVYYTPADMGEEFKQLLGDDLKFVPQKDGDLGERLYNGFKESSSMGYPAAIAEPITPEMLGAIACIRRKFVGSSFCPTI